MSSNSTITSSNQHLTKHQLQQDIGLHPDNVLSRPQHQHQSQQTKMPNATLYREPKSQHLFSLGIDPIHLRDLNASGREFYCSVSISS